MDRIRTGTGRPLVVPLLCLLVATTAVARIPEAIENDPDQVYRYLKELQASGHPYDFIDDLADLEELDPDLVEEVKGRLRDDDEREAREYDEQLQREIAAETAAEAQRADQWLQNTSNILVGAYQELPPGTPLTGGAAAGGAIARSSEYYQQEITRLEQTFQGYLTDLRATEARVSLLTANLQSHEALSTFWTSLDFLGTDDRGTFLTNELAAANARLPFLRAMTVASGEELQNTIRAADQYERTLVLTGIKADPALLASDYQRRVNEVVVLQQELAVSRLQFVAGQAQFDGVIRDLDATIATETAAGNTAMADAYTRAQTKVTDTYQLWRSGIEVSLANKGKAVSDAFSQNASDGVGPVNDVQLISHLAGCGVDPGLVLAGRDPNTGEFVYPDAAGRIQSAADSALAAAQGARFGRSLQYDWGDFAFDATDAFLSTDTITGAPGRGWAYTKGVGKAVGSAVYDFGVFVVEAGDTMLETDQYYFNLFVQNTPVINSLGIEINWFGQENIQAGGQFINWLSEDYSGNMYNATQSVSDWLDRRREMQAGSGKKGELEAIEDVGFGVGTVATIFVGPEELLIRAAARAGATGGRTGAGVARVGEATTEASQAGGRTAAVASDAAVTGAQTSAVAGDVGTAAGVTARSTVDVSRFPGTSVTILKHENGVELVVRDVIGEGAGVTVYAHPNNPNLVIKITDKTGSDLNRLGAAALDGADPTAVKAPRVHATYDVSTPEMPGHTVQIVDRAPPNFESAAANAIKTAGGDMTTGQQEALGLFLDDLASRGWGVADLKANNFTSWRTGPGDAWVVVPIDSNMYVPFKSPDAARAFHDALLNPPSRYLDGAWRDTDLLAGGQLDNLGQFQTDLSRFDGDVDWDRIADLTGERLYDTLGPGQTGFPYNPRLGKQFPSLRAGDEALDAAGKPPLRAPGAAGGPAAVSPLPPNSWIPPFRRPRAAPPEGAPYGTLTGYPPGWLQGMGVTRMPGFLGAPPVPARCLPAPQPGAGTAATGKGLLLHVPLNWLKNTTLFPDSPTTVSLLPFTTGRFLIGQCDNGACPDATAVIALSYLADDEAQVAGAVNQLGVIWSGPDNLRSKQSLPDDPYLSSRGAWGQSGDDQWALKKVGLDAAALEAAWQRIPAGSAPVVVAVIDTGVAWNHRDLSIDRLWTNRGEVPANGEDDDGNGYIDDVAGWNFVNQNNVPWDLDGHGTLVAGIIAATGGNGRGIAGVNPRARIMALKALDDMGNARASWLAEAIVYASNNGARIINLSVGGSGLTPTEQLAVDYAQQRGVLVVAAAGNEGIELTDYGPAGARRVLTVAASDEADARLPSSNRGAPVSLTAPGKDILGPRAIRTDLMANAGLPDYRPGANVVGADRGYFRATGTSFAAPIVSGVASLLLAINPALTSAQIERMLLQSAVDIETPGLDQVSGYGRLDARAALAADPARFVTARVDGVRLGGSGDAAVVEVLGTADADAFGRAWLELGTGENPATWQRVERLIAVPVRDGLLLAVDARQLAGSGSWTLRLRVEHRDGGSREARFLLSLN